MKKIITCSICSKPIERQDDLVTARYRLKIFPYHQACYTYGLKSKDSFFVSNKPLNGLAGNLATIIYFLFGLGWLLLADESIRLIGYVMIVPIIYRLYSYLAFERHVK